MPKQSCQVNTDHQELTGMALGRTTKKNICRLRKVFPIKCRSQLNDSKYYLMLFLRQQPYLTDIKPIVHHSASGIVNDALLLRSSLNQPLMFRDSSKDPLAGRMPDQSGLDWNNAKVSKDRFITKWCLFNLFGKVSSKQQDEVKRSNNFKMTEVYF